MKYLNCFSYIFLIYKLMYITIHQISKLVFYNINQGFETGVFGNQESFGLCFSYSIFYSLSIIILIAYKRIKYGYLVAKILSIIWVSLMLLFEGIGYFQYREGINIENIFYTSLIFIFMVTYKNYSCEIPLAMSNH